MANSSTKGGKEVLSPTGEKKRGNSTKVDVKRWVSDGRRFATGNERSIERKPWF